jgi:hypothetical protein
MPIQKITTGVIDGTTTFANTAISGTITASQIATVNANTITSGTIPLAQVPQLTTAKLPAGSVLQVVSATKLDAFTTSSTTAIDVTGLSVSITPTSASSKILVLSQIWGTGTADTGFYINLVRDSTNLSISTAGSSINTTISSYFGNENFWSVLPIMFLDSPATTSSRTYKIQIFTSNGSTSVAINKRVNSAFVGGSSSITVMEIAA